MNRSTYYKHFNTPPAKRTVQNQQLRSAILDIYAKSRKRFGAYKIKQRLLTEYGTSISIGRVYRLMKKMQLPKMSTIKPKYLPHQKDTNLEYPNFLMKQFNPPAPNQVWVSDITYIRVGDYFCYLCVIIDLFARKVISYNISRKITSGIVIAAFQYALDNRDLSSGVLFHSDRGVQYTSTAFKQLLDNLDFVQSFSAKAHPYDNAVAESFFKFLKLEETNRKTYNSIHELQLSLFEYMHFYNSQRPHSANDGLTPNQKEMLFFNSIS